MKVYKFGGASVATEAQIRNLPKILEEVRNEKIVIIVSAMGKTTNALEKVAEAYFQGNLEEAIKRFEEIEKTHIELTELLLEKDFLDQCKSDLQNFFTEISWQLTEKPIHSYDFYYDQIVCTGELMSTTIVEAFLKQAGFKSCWTDVRDLIKTDRTFRDATIEESITQEKIQAKINALFNEFHYNMCVTQGFIGATDQNESTTLGREGSDYTGAVFANMLNAESLTIWKDVPGILNADPRKITDTQKIAQLTYEEIIEMAYYGAQVIHPKTIKPLQNKNIPLLVRCFSDPYMPGTDILSKTEAQILPPIYVIKENQLFFRMFTKDFSFIGDRPIEKLYALFIKLKIRPSLIQTGAINLQLSMDNDEEKKNQLLQEASDIFNIKVEEGYTLLTIRHYTKEVLKKAYKDYKVVLSQRNPTTFRILFKKAEHSED